MATMFLIQSVLDIGFWYLILKVMAILGRRDRCGRPSGEWVMTKIGLTGTSNDLHGRLYCLFWLILILVINSNSYPWRRGNASVWSNRS